MRGGGAKSCYLLKGEGGHKFYPVSRGGGYMDPRFSRFVAPLPVINDQFLTLVDIKMKYSTSSLSSILSFIHDYTHISHFTIIIIGLGARSR